MTMFLVTTKSKDKVEDALALAVMVHAQTKVGALRMAETLHPAYRWADGARDHWYKPAVRQLKSCEVFAL
jgi:hypothetical protein